MTPSSMLHGCKLPPGCVIKNRAALLVCKRCCNEVRDTERTETPAHACLVCLLCPHERHAITPALHAPGAPLSPPPVAGYKTSDVSFAIVQALYMRGHYREAREQLTALIRSDPQNERAAAFLELLRETVVSEGRVGLALIVVGGLVAVAAGATVLGWLFKRGGKVSSSGAGGSQGVAGSATGAGPVAAAAVATWVDTIAAAGDVAQEGFSSVAQAWRERYNARIGGTAR